MISFFPKNTEEVDLEKALKRYAKMNYSDDNKTSIYSEFSEIQRIRSKIILLSENPRKNSEQIISDLEIYYSKLHLLSSTFPFKKEKSLLPSMRARNDAVSVEFKWNDTFREDKCTISSDPSLEKINVLYSIAIYHSIVAVKQNRSKEDGMKKAIKNYMRSASILKYLTEHVSSNVSMANLTMDLSHDALLAASNIMLAQAQTCFFERAREQNYSNSLIAKLAIGAAEFFLKASSLLDKDPLHTWIKRGDYPFHKHVRIQKYLFIATAYFWESKARLEDKEYGQEIALLKKAAESVKSAIQIKHRNVIESVEKSEKNLQGAIDKELQRAVTDNDSIYHFRVPDLSELVKIGVKVLAEVEPLDITIYETRDGGNNVISQLIPLEIVKLSKKLSEILAMELEKMEEEFSRVDQERNELLTLLNLPAKISIATDGRGFPPDVSVLIEEMKKVGGSELINNRLANVKTLLKNTQSHYQRIMDMLKGEENAYLSSKSKYNAYLNIVPSNHANQPYYREANTIDKCLKEAQLSNQKMEERWEALKPLILYIESKCDEDEAKLCEMAKSPEVPPDIVKGLRSAYDVEQRLSLEMKEFLSLHKKENSAKDYTQSILKRKSAAGSLSSSNILHQLKQEKLTSIQTTQKEISCSIASQMDTIKSLNSQFDSAIAHSEKGSNSDPSKMIQRYRTALQNFEKIKKSFDSGENFFRDLSLKFVSVLDRKVQEFTRARQEELDRYVCLLESSQTQYSPLYPGPSGPYYPGV